MLDGGWVVLEESGQTFTFSVSHQRLNSEKHGTFNTIRVCEG